MFGDYPTTMIYTKKINGYHYFVECIIQFRSHRIFDGVCQFFCHPRGCEHEGQGVGIA